MSDDQKDEAVLSALRDAGSDLTKRTDIVFYLYIPGAEFARAAATTLREHGFRTAVKNPLGRLSDGSYESRYSVVARIDEIPSLEFIRSARRLCQTLAVRYLGEYDGWEAVVAL